MRVLETVQYRTPLAVAFHDLLGEGAITDGLSVSARRVGHQGPFRTGYPTPSGTHVLAGLGFLRDEETPHPLPGGRVEPDDDPSIRTVDVEVLVEDRLGRFLPTVLLLTAPLDHVATALDALALAPALAWSVPAETPMFLLSTPTRMVPRTTALVRASVRVHSSGAPAAHALIAVDTPVCRVLGAADLGGNAVVAFPYPEFDPSGAPGSLPAGSHGTPTLDQQWPVTVTVRFQPSALASPRGVAVPYAHALLSQGVASVFADDAGPAQPALAATLHYGAELQLETGGVAERDRKSYLYVEPAP